MFFYTKQALRAAIKETPEGRVYYPNGRTGYLIDARTEGKLARFLTTFFFVQIAVIMIFVSLGSETNHRVSAMIAAVATALAIRQLGLGIVLRGAPRAATPMNREDALLRTAATYGSRRIWLMILLMLILVPTPLYVLRGEPAWERAAMVAVFAASAIYACVFAMRVERARRAMAHPAVAERA